MDFEKLNWYPNYHFRLRFSMLSMDNLQTCAENRSLAVLGVSVAFWDRFWPSSTAINPVLVWMINLHPDDNFMLIFSIGILQVVPIDSLKYPFGLPCPTTPPTSGSHLWNRLMAVSVVAAYKVCKLGPSYDPLRYSMTYAPDFLYIFLKEFTYIHGKGDFSYLRLS
jgi:hypothetical protein